MHIGELRHMPELPEVETVCRALKPILEGKSLLKIQVKRPDLRYPLPSNLESALKTKTIYRVRRRAKYILIDFNPELTLVWHLGMSGRVIIEKVTNPLKNQRHDHVIFITSDGYKIIFRDPRRFGFMQLYSTNELEKVAPFNLLGPEPIGDKSFSAAILHTALKHRSVSIKNALLNQHIIAGLGNIYVSEALWQACLSPLRSAKTLSLKETEILFQSVSQCLQS